MWTHVLTAAVTAAVTHSVVRGTVLPAAPRLPQPRQAGSDARRDATDSRRRLQQVVADDDLDIALQPLVSLVDGRVEGVEALARFRDGRGPAEWFGEARACGMTRALDGCTFGSALELLDAVPDDVYLSVNASPELLVDGTFRRRLTSAGRPLDRLVIEITEHARVPDYGELKAAVDALREQSVRFAIDDTGAGYASFNHVLQLRPDIIKLDRGLVTGLDSDPARRSLVTALVLLALEIGATVTGEGVETPGQLESLATLGVDQAQGYLLARPTLDREAWAAWWAQRLDSPVTTI